MKTILIILFAAFVVHKADAQNTHKFYGKITDERNKPLSGASVYVVELKLGTMTEEHGNFEFPQISAGNYHVHISYLGYKCIEDNQTKISNSDTYQVYILESEDVALDEITVEGLSEHEKKSQKTSAVDFIDNDFIKTNLSINLVKSIETLPGISSIDVGQGFSKPVIRGLGFNRVAVTEHGIKQEGQQWGADHGLEIDQFAVERLEIVKGPSSLMFGSDAVGGVIQILPNKIPDKHTAEGSLQSVFKSVNNQIVNSLNAKYRHHEHNFYVRFTRADFGDYTVPADSFFYNRYRFPIQNKTLNNTAGKEQDAYFSFGTAKKQFKSTFSLSSVNSKVGFFPGSHGIPSAGKLADDGNARNIELPYQQVSHFKIVNNTTFFLEKGSAELNLGYQKNNRQEWSLFHTHYQNQTAPELNPDLELLLNLNTLSSDLKYKYRNANHVFQTGISAQYQDNTIGGYLFLLPEYVRKTVGAFAYNSFTVNSKVLIDGGIRFDFGQTDIEKFYSVYAERYKSEAFSAKFYDVSWAIGTSYSISKRLNIKSSVGKSFRMPNASELSANGIHHGSFRYEVGNKEISSEYSYQFDVGLNFSNQKISGEVNFFTNFFPNFIYLSPSGSYLHPSGYEISEADAGQVYEYIQSEAFRTGGECSISYQIAEPLTVTTSAEYVYATDFEYPIPFTPPLNIYSSINYSIPNFTKHITASSINLNTNFTSAQHRIARNELPTPRSNIWNLAYSGNVIVSKTAINITLQLQNMFDTKYFNHLSFYRIIELPEPGRNMQIQIEIPINRTFSK